MPAQFRTSVAKRLGSGLSCSQSQYKVHLYFLFQSSLHSSDNPTATSPFSIVSSSFASFTTGLQPNGITRTIVRPLIPIIKSNHGSRGTSRLAFLSTWKPYAPLVADCCSSLRGAASSREIKRFSAPNMDIIRGCEFDDSSGERLFEDDERGVKVVEMSLLMTWRFWKVAIARDLRRASEGRHCEDGNLWLYLDLKM